jgi:hypothetical protein
VPLQNDVFSLLVDQGIMGVRGGALVVFLYGGSLGDGGVEDLPHKLAEVESLLGGARVVLGFTSGLGHTSLLFGIVTDGPASEGEEIARTRLAGVAVVFPFNVGKARELENVVRALPTSSACRWCHGGIGVPSSWPTSVRPWGKLGLRAKDAQRRGNIGARADGRVLETAKEAGVDVLVHPGTGGGSHVPEAGEEAGVHRDDGLESVMPYLARMSRRYLD